MPRRKAYENKDVQVVTSGSSSVELADKIEEPMTGRKFDYTLMPPSFAELEDTTSAADELRQFERRMVFGMYPEVVAHLGDEVERLKAIGKGYLYKYTLSVGDTSRQEILDKLLRALAFQIGQEVSYSNGKERKAKRNCQLRFATPTPMRPADPSRPTMSSDFFVNQQNCAASKPKSPPSQGSVPALHLMIQRKWQ